MRRDGLWLAIDMAVASPTLLGDMPVRRTWDGQLVIKRAEGRHALVLPFTWEPNTASTSSAVVISPNSECEAMVELVVGILVTSVSIDTYQFQGQELPRGCWKIGGLKCVGMSRYFSNLLLWASSLYILEVFFQEAKVCSKFAHKGQCWITPDGPII